MNKDVLLNSVVGMDFLLYDNHPDLDTFLDYRIHVRNEMVHNKKFPLQWYKNEIMAIDEIIKILNVDKNARRRSAK